LPENPAVSLANQGAVVAAIIFVHKGYSEYLEYSLRQATHTSRTSEVFLLGDASNDRFPFIKHVDISGYRSSADEFAGRYEQMSSNDYEFELFCFQRWFIIKDFMERSGLERAFVCDSDVMSYCDIDCEEAKLGPYSAAFCLPARQTNYRWCGSAHVSFWSLKTLVRFCTYALDSYTDAVRKASLKTKWEYHLDTNRPGGVCDMTVLYLFALENEIINLSAIRDGSSFDHNINHAENEFDDEYEMARGIKRIRWEHGRPYGFNVRAKRWVRFNTLHFQGALSKASIHRYYRGPMWFPVSLRQGLLVRGIRMREKARNILSRSIDCS